MAGVSPGIGGKQNERLRGLMSSRRSRPSELIGFVHVRIKRYVGGTGKPTPRYQRRRRPVKAVLPGTRLHTLSRKHERGRAPETEPGLLVDAGNAIRPSERWRPGAPWGPGSPRTPPYRPRPGS